MGAGTPPPRGEGHRSHCGCVGGCIGRCVCLSRTAPHMRGAVAPPPRGGRHLLRRYASQYIAVHCKSLVNRGRYHPMVQKIHDTQYITGNRSRCHLTVQWLTVDYRFLVWEIGSVSRAHRASTYVVWAGGGGWRCRCGRRQSCGCAERVQSQHVQEPMHSAADGWCAVRESRVQGGGGDGAFSARVRDRRF